MSISSKQLIDAFFDQNNGRQKVTHQIESFNYFMSVVVPETLKNAGPLVITGSPDLNLTGKTRAAAGTAGTAIRVSIENNDEVAEAPKSRPREVTVTIEFANVQIRKPTIFENNGAVTPMYPNDARLRNLTYACSLYCDLLATFTMKEWPKSDSEGTGEPIVTTCQRTLPHVHVGRIPVMVGSETCLMSELPEKTPSEFGECSEDVGGYFIIQGGERVIISQERMAENYPFVFRQNKARKKDIEVIDVKSIGPDNEGAPKSFSVKIIRPARFSHGTTNSIVVTCPRIKAPVPLFIMMRALGIPDDRSIVELIIGSDSDAYTSILEESIRNAEGVTTTEGALEWIRLHLGNGSGSRETLTSNTLRPVRSSTPPPIRDILAEECLPHIGGASMEFEKACYIALITRRLLDVNAGILAPDDRDSYTNKKVELPGNLMGNLFRFLFCSKVVKDIKSTITKEIHNGFWKSSGKIMDILNQSNVYKILKSTTISVGMKSALATGNFASGKMGIKAGISQVLNRLTYLSGISHLRRLSTPIEKTGKLLAPRKLHNTQWGFVCPAETPEGHAVGVVKNLASLAVVSLPISAEPVVAFLYDVLKMSELNPKMIPIPAGTRVFVNGAWIGMLYLGSKETVAAIALLRAAKRCGRIHPHTGITFKFHQNEVWINTEGGRLMRPLLFAPAVREILKSKINPFSEREMTWNDLMKWKTLRGHSLIEFVDATETENLFIAMDLENLKLDHDYTHLEIHPATILGAMTSNIPFSDHNQSPRNVYQCLHPDETVRMADGSEKRIADVRIGDEVQVFNPVTLEMSLSHVIHQYVRPTDKRIFRLTAAGGRTLTATENHPLMTQRGWVHVGDLKPDTDLLACVAEVGEIDPRLSKFIPIETFEERILFREFQREFGKTYSSYDSFEENIDSFDHDHNSIVADYRNFIASYDLESKGSAIFVPIYNKVEVENCEVSDITVESDHHSFITSHGIMSSNSAMGKQATGVYALNFRQRMDTMANLIWYSSVPLVNSFMGQYFSKESMSSGYNIIVAIMPYGGYNQEDSLMFNKASLDRGLFSTEFYRTYKDEEKKNQASGEEEKFCKPLSETTRLRQHANYNKLDPATGFVPVNTFVTHEDVLIGKVAPIRLRGVDGAAMAGLNHATLQGMSAVAAAQTVQNAGGKRYKDASKLMRTNESGFVDCIYRGRNGDGFSSVKIRIREHRRPEVGDKFSSRHGQKGTCGLILAPEDMPFTASGIIPDLIINPHCLAEDHEILTEHGFMNWSEVKEGYESGLLRVAGYDHETGHLVYEHPTDFILNERSERDMIEFSHSEEVTNSNGVSLLVTTDHDMFARKGRNYGDGVTWDGVQKGPRGASHRVVTDYEKIKAVDLLTADAIKFIGKARSGVITEDIKGPAFIEAYKTRNFTAFCELYGYWLGDGTLRFNGNSVEMSPVKVVDNEWLHERFAALELKEGIDFTYNVIGEQSEARPVRYRFSIINREWFNFFCAEYGKKYAKYETSTTAPEVTSVTNPEKIKSAKWMAPWVWNLSANMARSILVGLRFADGCEKANRNIIWTSSSRFRDEIVRLAIHAGYSVNFKIQHNINDVCGHDKEGREIIARHVSWSISYTDTPRGSEPVLNVARDVKKTAYDGRTWCVTMPHGFIITRRVIREDAVVVQASRPIITGQCIPSRMTLAHIMETVVGRACCEGGFMGDGTPFNSKMTAEAVGEELTKRGLHHSSDEVLYCGYTGKQMPTNIFQGPCHYQRLKHMVADKIHSRATGPLVILTRQPAEGRARDGGLRIGEMERDVLIAHGVSLMLKERLLEMSDNFEVHVCKGCGMLGIANFARNIWCCRGCGNKTDFSKLRIPYAYKLFLQELESMSVTSRILTDSRLRQLTN